MSAPVYVKPLAIIDPEYAVRFAPAMARPFLNQVGFLLLINLLIKPVFIFGIDLAVQNRVGPEAYGAYFALFNFAFLFNVLLDFGINNFNQRLIAREPRRVALWLPNILWVKALLALAFVVAVFATALLLRFDGAQLRLLGWIALGRILLSYHMFFRSNVSGLQAFRTDSVLSVLDRLLSILLIGALLYTPLLGRAFRIEDFVYGTVLALAVTAGLSLLALRLRSGPLTLSRNRRLPGLVIKRAYPFALLGVLMTIYNRVDGVMLERMLGDDGELQAGIYAAAYRLLDAGTMFAFLIAGILLPLFARMRKTGADVWPIARTSARLLFTLSATATAVGIVYAQPLMSLLYTGADAYWSRTFSWLIGGFVFNALVYVFGSLLTAESRLRGLNVIALSGVALNIILNLILIPRAEALGAAVATLITQGLVAAAHLWYTGRVFNWHRNLLVEGPRIATFAAVLAATGVLLQRLDLPWIGGAAVLCLVATGFALLLRLPDPRELRNALRTTNAEPEDMATGA